MNMLPTITTLRSFITYQFTVLQMRALRARFWAKLSGVPTELLVFPGHERWISPGRKLIGTKSIRVDQIVGSLTRNTDFDSYFRPLKKHSLDRWVQTYILHARDGWSPIIVHQVNDQYFVEDGHHRVSVARALGMDFIDANVWEHSTQAATGQPCRFAKCAEKNSPRVYAPS